jgi:polyisoprenoid-binding protein YceI
MNRSKYLALLFCVPGVLLLSAVIPVQKKYALSDNHSIVINGTSNLHDWSEQVGTVTGDASGTINKDKSFDLAEINIKMDVSSIKSTKGAIMDNNTYKALKADKHPYIIYMLKQPVKVILPGSGKKTIFTKGRLTIAGITRDANMTVTLVMRDSGKFIFEGSQVLKMTDYGIVPPTALLGSLKTGNEITITFKSEFKAMIKK